MPAFTFSSPDVIASGISGYIMIVTYKFALKHIGNNNFININIVSFVRNNDYYYYLINRKSSSGGKAL